MHAVIQWMKEFLILYLVLTIFMQLAAADEYKKYLRFLSGMILLLVLCSPLLRLLTGDGGLSVLQSYDRFFEQLDAVSHNTGGLQLQQDGWGLSAYEDALAADIRSQAQQEGYPIASVSVSLSETYQLQRVTIWLEQADSQKQPLDKAQLADFFMRTYQLQQTQIMIYES